MWTSRVAEISKYFSSTSGATSLRRFAIGESVVSGLGVASPRGELPGVDDAGKPGVARWAGIVAISH